MRAYPPSPTPRLFPCLLRILPIDHVSFSSAHSHVPIIINSDKSCLILLEAQLDPKSGEIPMGLYGRGSHFFLHCADLGRPL